MDKFLESYSPSKLNQEEIDNLNGPITRSEIESVILKKPKNSRASLAAQWLRIHLPMQGTWVQALVQEDPTCRGATKPMSHNY